MVSTTLRHGISLFNRGRFFDAHEVLEEIWRPARGGRRRFLQALIQVAVGFHHHSRGNLAGARSLLARGGNTLTQYPSSYAGLKLDPLRTALDAWLEALAEGRAAPPLPRLALTFRARSARKPYPHDAAG
jgi:hypothetical protein